MSTLDLQYVPERQAQQAILEYQNGKTDQPMIFVNGRTSNNKPLRLTYELEALGEIITSTYGQSILVKFIDPHEYEEFSKIEDIAERFLPKGIKYRELVRDDKFFLKLYSKDGKYKATFNPPASPTSAEKSGVQQGSVLDVEFQPNLWINFETGTGGIFLNVMTITVDGGSKKKTVSRKR